MPKDYICKDCTENKYGWCKQRKTQVNNLKNLKSCQFKPTVVDKNTTHICNFSNSVIHANENTNLNVNHEIKQSLIEAGNVIGKREMLLYIQRACITNGGSLTLKDICKYDEVCSTY